MQHRTKIARALGESFPVCDADIRDQLELAHDFAFGVTIFKGSIDPEKAKTPVFESPL